MSQEICEVDVKENDKEERILDLVSKDPGWNLTQLLI